MSNSRYPGPANSVDVLARAPSARNVLDEDEINLRWVEETWEIYRFRLEGGIGVERYAGSLDTQDKRRIRAVNAWAKRNGGLWTAIHSDPILAFDNGEVIDGTHRLVAALMAGLRSVTVLVARL